MAESDDSFTATADLVRQASRLREEHRVLVEKARQALEHAREEATQVAQEYEGVLAFAVRNFPERRQELQSIGDKPVGRSPDTPMSGVKVPNDWSKLKRYDAVMRAVRQVTNEAGYATPEGIRIVLAQHGRNDGLNAIGATLSRLRTSFGKVKRLDRGQWVPTDIQEVLL